MMLVYIVVEKKVELSAFSDIQNTETITAKEYIENEFFQQKKLSVINLCDSYGYQSTGYYVSLLAEARKHKVIPTVTAMQDIKTSTLIKTDLGDWDDLIQKSFQETDQEKIEFNVYFGTCKELSFLKLALTLLNISQLPLLKAVFVRKAGKWYPGTIRQLSIKDLTPEEFVDFKSSLASFLKGKKLTLNYERKKYSMGILVNHEDQTPPSNAKALNKFVKEADKAGYSVEFITKNDFARLLSFDAVFVRETTNVNHHTYRFAKKAESEGIVVIDDSQSILRCTNKVFLHELLSSNGIPVPKAVVVHKSQNKSFKLPFEYPAVIKQPDGSFSKGVLKVNNHEELKRSLKEMFQKSDLLIIQEFMPTDFDWRVGVLNGNPLYVCKYYMARNHWQIYNWDKKKGQSGKSETLNIEEVPKKLLNIAVKASKLIGNGLYGVDVKQKDGKYFVIEINDNPSIDAGVEDKASKNFIYKSIVQEFTARIKNIK
ncbi:RimK family protein [Mangrovivirga cuniculi]|uniref:RimK family alpha-L-glutamate ligase n=1 Tax=Mangrovivirga cuniculi TaxID=2715131 RepID=A0A4D7K7I2_9BACT|nr:RimK family protein [Mangrovivirga cuniculi]QCK16684.1 RimK family alpha-L-glutamate ligase [Mangrovivirga cuniculi]